MYRVITISREFGSGGRTIAKETAERLGWKYYDKELVKKIAEECGLAESYILESGEYACSTNSFLFSWAMNAAAGRNGCRGTRSRAVIIKFLVPYFTSSRTFNKGSLPDKLSCLSAHYFCYFFSALFAGRRASIDGCFAFGNCLSKSVTACISASTAVIARKCFSDFNFFFVYFNVKNLFGNTEKNCNNKSYSGNNH